MSTRRRIVALLTLAPMALAAVAVAQQSYQPRPNEQGQQSQIQQRQGQGQFGQARQGQQGQGQQIDGYLAACLLAKNEAEVKFAQWAQQRAQDQETKQFAEKLVEEHQQMIEKLQPIARQQSNRQTVGAGGQYGIQQTGATAETGSDNVAERLQAINKQIIDRASQMVQSKLQQKPAKEFDECFLGAEIGCHIQQLAELEVIEDQASGKLRQIVQESKPMVEQHLQEAEQLMKQQTDTRQARAQR